MDASTTRLLDAYIEQRSLPQQFLTSFFKLSPRGIYNGEYVEVDLRRSEPRIAVPVPSLESGARKVENTTYDNKKWKAPVYKEETTISASTSDKREIGHDSFEDPDFRRNVLGQAFRAMTNLEERAQLAVELQASQVLQTGAVTLKDELNGTVYSLDFQPRASHFVTPTPWAEDGSTGDPEAAIGGLADQLRTHGKQDPTDVILGEGALRCFFANTKMKTRWDNRGLQTFQSLQPVKRGQGATSYGMVHLAGYDFRLWSYKGFYIDPATQEVTKFVGDKKVIVMAGDARRDLTFGSIPMFMPPDARVMQFLPGRMTSVESGFDLTTNVWVSPNGEHLNLFVGTRPLCLPVALDTFGCLTVG